MFSHAGFFKHQWELRSGWKIQPFNLPVLPLNCSPGTSFCNTLAGKAEKVKHPSPLLPLHPCWSLQPTPGSAFPLNSAGIHNLAPHIGDFRRVPSKAQGGISRGDTEATDCSMQNPRRGGGKKRQEPWPRPTQAVGWVHVQAALSAPSRAA